ncbi:MAG: hypothetical protein WBP61_11370, partial [Nocardioides sp.]
GAGGAGARGAGGRGTAGARGAGGAGGAGRVGRKDDEKGRTADPFEADEDWVGQDEAAPGVLG